jgi:large subunit ribosomal protein L10
MTQRDCPLCPIKKEVFSPVASAIDVKKEIVAEITDKFQRSVATVVLDYRGLKVGEVTEFRRQCREQNLEYKVYKNTLMRMAAKNAGMEELVEELVGPNAILFSYEDPVAAAKVANDFAKTHKSLELKVGFVEGIFYDEAKLKEFALIPSREELIAKLLGSLKAPVSNFVYLLQAIIDKREAEGT